MLRLLLLLLLTGTGLVAFPNGYQYRRSLTVDFTKVSTADQTSFPVLVSGTYSYLATTANGGKVQSANGYDIIFTSDLAGTTKLTWEVEQYTATTGQLVAWVKIPTLSHTVNTVFYVFYGNSSVSTSQTTASSVWDTNYKAVYHLSGATLSVADSTVNANSLTNHGAAATTGETDGGATFDGTTQYAGLSSTTGLDITTQDYTLECWLKAPATAQYANVISKRQGTSPYGQWVFGVGSVNSGGGAVSGQTLYLFNHNGTNQQGTHTTGNYADGTWHHVMATRTSTGISFYVDGATAAVTVDSAGVASENVTNTGNFNLGFDNGTAFYNGSLDEVRVSIGVARAASWEVTSYNSQSSPSTFYAVGAEQQGGVGGPSLIEM